MLSGMDLRTRPRASRTTGGLASARPHRRESLPAPALLPAHEWSASPPCADSLAHRRRPNPRRLKTLRAKKGGFEGVRGRRAKKRSSEPGHGVVAPFFTARVSACRTLPFRLRQMLPRALPRHARWGGRFARSGTIAEGITEWRPGTPTGSQRGGRPLPLVFGQAPEPEIPESFEHGVEPRTETRTCGSLPQAGSFGRRFGESPRTAERVK